MERTFFTAETQSMNNVLIDPQALARSQADLAVRGRELFQSYTPDDVINLLDQTGNHVGYTAIPTAVARIWHNISRTYSAEGFATFQGMTMLKLMLEFEGRSGGLTYTEAILARFRQSFERILQGIADPAFEPYCSVTDNLLKDLALCRQLMFPAGARIVERGSGFPRSLLIANGAVQALRGMQLLARTRGNRPFFQSHVHLLELDAFNPEGWWRFLVDCAEMLVVNPEIRGYFGSSWLYDPVLTDISPRLAYHLEEPLGHGAVLLFSRVDIKGGALAKSQTRQALYEAGQYLPSSYALIWPRRDMIRWLNTKTTTARRLSATDRIEP
jgi:hypothetical protein